ncbi:MAG: hypothetical protein ACTHML_20290 [Ginsengibacter sp.]
MALVLQQKRIYFDSGAQGLLLLLGFSLLFFNNALYLFSGMLLFGYMIYRLQIPYKPSVFTIVFLYHFIQVSAWVWMVNYMGVDINFKSPHSGLAVMLAYLGLIVLLGPVIYFNDKIPAVNFSTLKKHADKLSIQKTFIAYVIAFFSLNALGAAAFSFSGLSQIIISLVNVKWFFFLLFGFQVVIKRKMVREFVIFVGVEFALGFFSFFSDFKTVFFFLACLLLTFLVKVSLKQLVLAVVAVIFAAFMGITWTAIKGEYRTFLNQGSKTQTVQVSQGAAFDKLVELTEQEKDTSASISFFDRLQYTWHIAKAMDHVPSVVPYQNGNNWLESISFALTPRYFNPDKPKYEASIKATKYTGISYLGARSGVSFSLGYFADGYVDFGYFGMFIPLFFLGLVYGIVYYYFLRHSSSNFIFNYAVVGALFMEFNALEMDSTYLTGRLFSDLLTFFMLRLFFFPWLVKYLAWHEPEVQY